MHATVVTRYVYIYVCIEVYEHGIGRDCDVAATKIQVNTHLE